MEDIDAADWELPATLSVGFFLSFFGFVTVVYTWLYMFKLNREMDWQHYERKVVFYLLSFALVLIISSIAVRSAYVLPRMV